MSKVGGTIENDSCPKLQRDENIILITIEFFHRNFGSISWSRVLKSKSGDKPRSCVSSVYKRLHALRVVLRTRHDKDRPSSLVKARRGLSKLFVIGTAKLLREGKAKIGGLA